MSKQLSTSKSEQPLAERKQRFQVVQLEERIAPTTWGGGYYYYYGKGHYNPHGKWVGGGRHRGGIIVN